MLYSGLYNTYVSEIKGMIDMVGFLRLIIFTAFTFQSCSLNAKIVWYIFCEVWQVLGYEILPRKTKQKKNMLTKKKKKLESSLSWN